MYCAKYSGINIAVMHIASCHTDQLAHFFELAHLLLTTLIKIQDGCISKIMKK